MTETKTCTRCGAPLAKPDEPCARCLLELARTSAHTNASDAEVSPSRAAERRAKRRAVPSLAELARRFPELEIVAMVGEGGMGAVYEARQPKIERRVALKVLALDPRDDPTFAERFRREAIVLARLDHAHIVKLFDFGERDGLFFLLLEFVDGTNLRTLLKQGLLAPKQALAIVPQMCAALQYAHDEGIVHRDVKPENVLIDKQGRVKIADFGLAKLVDADPSDFSLTDVGQVMGTPHYMAPEQLRGARDVDHRADIYSLGVVFYEMLTGELPRGNFELPSKRIEVDVRLDEIVLKSLERAPERRYQHALEIKTDVEGVSASESPDGTKAGAGSFIAGLQIGRKSHAHLGRRRVAVHPKRAWHFFLVFLVLWPIVGAAFNGGFWWFVGALSVVAACFWSLMQHQIAADPELERVLQAEKRDVIAARHMTALLLLALGLAALYVGHIALFDQSLTQDRDQLADPSFMEDLFRTAVRANTNSSLNSAWVDANITSSRVAFEWLEQTSLFNQQSLLLVAIALCVGAAAVLGSRWEHLLKWHGWRMPLRTVSVLFGSLLVVDGFCLSLYTVSAFEHAADPPAIRAHTFTDFVGGHGYEPMERKLLSGLNTLGYRVTATANWFDAGAIEGTATREVRAFFAEPASHLARWHISWRGPRRQWPLVVATMARGFGSNSANVRVDVAGTFEHSSDVLQEVLDALTSH